MPTPVAVPTVVLPTLTVTVWVNELAFLLMLTVRAFPAVHDAEELTEDALGIVSSTAVPLPV